MRVRNLLLFGTVVASAFVIAAGPYFVEAQAQSAAGLTGKVTSAEEGPMEGVVVSAKKDDSTITVSAVTDAQGHFSLPASRLDPGHYTLKARAVGYDLDGSNRIDVAPGKVAEADLKLKKTRNLSSQLTNAEWLLSLPGTDEHKKFLLNCNGCHTLERIVKSTHDAEEFLQVFERMGTYYPGSTPTKPQRLVGTARRMGPTRGGNAESVAKWLATVNLSQQETRDYPLKTLPRLTGKSTQVIITEYDLPRPDTQPHDVIVDEKGIIWYVDFGQMFLGSMDPKTGKVTEYPIPETKKGFPVGALDLEADKQGNIWVGVMYQASIAKFDKKTGTFQSWSVPKEWDTDAAQLGHLAVGNSHVDGKVWIKNSDGTNIYRLDLATSKMENLGAPVDPATGKRVGTYGLHSDSKNNIYLLDFAAGNIGKFDAKTKAFSIYPTPTPNSRPRRGRVDSQDRLWFAEYGGNAIGMLDTVSGRIQEWKVPTPWSAPYDAVADKNGDAWTGSMLTDRVARLNTKTGQFIEYPLPRSTNIRRVFVDDTRNPGTLWVGSNHGASIVKVEPLE
jgi:virginiamycin B lyase